jgi:UDP-glucose 4-epimerase
MKIIITGGAGYIGSHTAVEALRAGHEVVIIDSFINSSRDVLKNIEAASGKPFVAIDMCMTQNPLDIAEKLFDVAHGSDAIIHFAALKDSPGSTKNPLGYYRNNIDSLLGALGVSKLLKIKNFIFSSSATVYGHPDFVPITETNRILRGTTPYGTSKIMGEWILEDVTQGSDMKSVALRYFNPAGADRSGLIGEMPIGRATNLVPIITQSAAGMYGPLKIAGSDFPTADGSAIRDYIHVTDLAKAHLSTLDWMVNHEMKLFETFNLGTGRGTSVIEMTEIFDKEVAPGLLKTEFTDRRSGDPAEVWCDPSKARRMLGWRAELTNSDILKSAWEWQKKLDSDI